MYRSRSQPYGRFFGAPHVFEISLGNHGLYLFQDQTQRPKARDSVESTHFIFKVRRHMRTEQYALVIIIHWRFGYIYASTSFVPN